MFKKKDYQIKTLSALEDYLKKARIYGPEAAYKECLGNEKEYKPINELENIPYICLRLPTGGGKTYLATETINLATKYYLEKDNPIVLWLVPSRPIKKQTIETLKNPKHPNRELLDSQFEGGVAIFDIDDFTTVKPQDIKNKVCIFVATIQSFRYEDQEGRKKYQHNENLDIHFSKVPHNTTLPLDRFSDGAEKGKIKYSFVNLLYLNNPLVIVDEAHNNTSTLSYEVLKRFNPACIIEYTATPSSSSNILYRVSAMELKLEEMIKLPLILTEYPSWQEAVTASVLQRKKLADIAKADKNYIRPIILFQAEDKNKEVTENVIKKYLIENETIPENKIAIATGDIRELDAIDDILSPNCEIEFVITKDALKEGWDCPFAYIFCSVANVNSKTKVEQLLGRVLRMPYAKIREQDALNKAYAYVSSTSWPNAVANLCDNLTKMGFNETEAETYIKPEPIQKSFEINQQNSKYRFTTQNKINTKKLNLSEEDKEIIEYQENDDGTASFVVCNETPVEIIDALKPAMKSEDELFLSRTITILKNTIVEESPSEKGITIDVPQLKLFINGEWILGDNDIRLPNGWNLLDYPSRLEKEYFDIRENGNTTEIDIDGKTITERRIANAQLQFEIANIDSGWTVEELSRWIDKRIYVPDVTMPIKLEFIRRIVDNLVKERNFALSTLVMRKHVLLKAIESKIKFHKRQALQKGFQTTFFSTTYNIKTDLDYTFTFSRFYPLRELYRGCTKFNKHFYSKIQKFDSKEEENCAKIIDSMTEVKYWVRNIMSESDLSFRLPTSSDYFYPDFYVLLNDGRHYVIEYKGKGFYTNDDSKEKRNIGELWAEKSNGKCLFKLVTAPELANNLSIEEQIRSIL